MKTVISCLVITAVVAGIFTIKDKEHTVQANTHSISQSVNFTEQLTIPEGYAQISSLSVQMDKTPVTLTRYERQDGQNKGLEGEHFSVIYDQQGRLKGFARIDNQLGSGQLPDRAEARKIAHQFLKIHAPDLLENSSEHFIEPHDEFIMVNGKKQKLTGMKVKMHNQTDGRWFWVIIGSDKKPMVFERDIVWINFPGRRQTEKWLHDEWLAKQKIK